MDAVMIAQGGMIEHVSIEEPSCGPDDVVVEVAACGVCGTDLHIADGDFAAARYPIVPGHEFSGRVVERGAEVTSVRVGDAVAVDPSLYCGRCHYCRAGKGNLCQRWNAIGVTVPGACAQLVKAPAANARVLPEGSDLAVAALIEPLACAVHGYDLVRTRLGDRHLVYGAGTMGLLMVQLASRVGALSVSVVEPNPARRALAERLGAADTAASAEELELTEGYEVVVDATGVIAAIEDGLGRVRPGGTFLQFGVASAGAMASVSPYQIYNREVTMVGSMAVLQSYERAADLAVAGLVQLEPLLSDRLPLGRYAEALDLARRGGGLKVQVQPGTASGIVA